jgi:hypothetical protein
MYTFRLVLQLLSCVTIRSRYPNIKLVSPVYFGSGVVCPKLYNQQVDINTAMRACFEINTTQDEFEGALLFKLQRHTDNQHNIDTSTTKTDGKTHVYMLIAWKVKDVKLFAYLVLVEYVKEFTWNEDKLKKLYYENRSQLKEYDDTISDIWSLNDNMVLQTSLDASDLRGNPKFSISISEEEYKYAMKPLCVDLKR